MAVWREDRHTGSCQPTDGAQLRNFPESRLRWRPCAAVRTEEGAAARDGSVPVSWAARVSTGRNACVSYSGSSRPGPPGRFLRAGRPLSVGTPCSRASPEPRPHCPHPAPFPGATGLRGRKARGAPLCRGGRSAPAMGGGTRPVLGVQWGGSCQPGTGAPPVGAPPWQAHVCGTQAGGAGRGTREAR